MARIKHQLQASTLIEVMVAMMIVMLVFGLAMTLFARIGASQRSALQVRAVAEMQQRLVVMEREQHWLDAEEITEDWRMVVIVRPYRHGDKSLRHVQMETYTNKGFLLGRRDKLIYLNDAN